MTWSFLSLALWYVPVRGDLRGANSVAREGLRAGIYGTPHVLAKCKQERSNAAEMQFHVEAHLRDAWCAKYLGRHWPSHACLTLISTRPAKYLNKSLRCLRFIGHEGLGKSITSF